MVFVPSTLVRLLCNLQNHNPERGNIMLENGRFKIGGEKTRAEQVSCYGEAIYQFKSQNKTKKDSTKCMVTFHSE